MAKLTLDDLNVNGKRVLVRVDFNVPLSENADGERTVSDDTRIRAALPTIRTILERGGHPILMSHLGRPNGVPDPRFSLAPVARHLQTVLGHPVVFAGAGADVPATADSVPENGVLLLENTRFFPGEKKDDDALAAEWAALADVFVDDAFGSAHRAHASTVGVTRHIGQSAMGYLLQRENDFLSRVLEAPERPFVAILGGAKVSDKIGVIENLLGRVDHLLIGGAMSYTFLRSLGHEVGTSLLETDRLDVARSLMERAGGKIILPSDHVAAGTFDNDAPSHTVSVSIPAGEMGLDIGTDTLERYRRLLLDARTIIWNGPMGVFEMPNFAKGTFSIAETLAEATDGGALTIVGGGDSVAAINLSGYQARISHISTGGGAMLEFLEGKVLPGIAALSDR